MNANEFVKKVSMLKPNTEDFQNVEISEESKEQYIAEFNVKKISDKMYENEIVNLISNYDVTSFRVHDITFDADYQQDNEYLYFGFDIYDRLIINKDNGKIFSYDAYGDRIVLACAENAEKFLDALYEIMKFSKTKMLTKYSEKIFIENSKKVAYLAALHAGGEEYEDYYKVMLGIE
ncbi:hypothetical protein [Mucilaginibacter phyllosphaerae]|uniref:SMI1/KNR4 family protein n=1 Tax=Mucilaginibacter phyllosphaerae TaxID=1812349 RepID=A0A4Y8A5R0_9SPHI|nr:hypothetical protein [Mucilaginibacter phyllosphaerae]MBB3971010.1 hypothetical protein [Mucilaginibacter phyllosphaerae]TEW63753.1 hypothetical protein E2R65_18460 [Mucilaginibacter phyllosphaerae]GGH21943.1 hypothetical protein GCM10007352_34950 [Mucilaginibacter phyllosphaerae]